MSTKEEIQKLIKELRQEQRTLLKTQGGRSEEYYSCEDYITMLKEDLKELRQKHHEREPLQEEHPNQD